VRILFISEIQWLSQPSRKHHLVRRFPDDWEVLFVSPINATRDENSLIERRDGRNANVRYASLVLPKPDAALPVVRAATGLLRALGGRALLSSVRSFRPDVVVCSFIWAAATVPAIRDAGVPVVYDVNDLHYEFYPRRREEAVQAFRDLVASSDEVVCSSAYLRSVCERGVVIGNGVDLDLFTARADRPIPEAIHGSRISGCEDLIAYVGSVDDRIDFALLGALLAALGELERRVGVVCVGRVFDSARRRKDDLEGRFPDRMLFTGRVPYEELPDYLSHAKVGIAPFVLNERTRAINPNKLYTYAAMGQNIVSTPFSKEVEDQGDLVYLASDPESFARASIAALGDDERRRAVRERIATPNGWGEKAQEFARLLSRVASAG
jgi:teichuronic acid biosynthesis glycosyltransferase TuaH